MARKQGCGSRLIGALFIVGLACWGIESCVQQQGEALRAEAQLRTSERSRESKAPLADPSVDNEHNSAPTPPVMTASADETNWRTWTSSNGKFKVEAKFVEFRDGTLTLEKKNGTTIGVTLEKLSVDDQELVRRRTGQAVSIKEPIDDGVKTSAYVIRARLVHFTTDSGKRTQKVLVDWKNTGTTTIRAVDADIIPYDARGNRLEPRPINYTIYAVADSSPGIAPGDTYQQSDNEGFILAPGTPRAAKVKVVITKVLEMGAF